MRGLLDPGTHPFAETVGIGLVMAGVGPVLAVVLTAVLLAMSGPVPSSSSRPASVGTAAMSVLWAPLGDTVLLVAVYELGTRRLGLRPASAVLSVVVFALVGHYDRGLGAAAAGAAFAVLGWQYARFRLPLGAMMAATCVWVVHATNNALVAAALAALNAG